MKAPWNHDTWFTAAFHKGGDTQTTTTSNEPSEFIKPFWQQGLNRAVTDILNNPAQFFGGNTFVGMDPSTEQSLQARQRRGTEGSPLAGQSQDYMSDVMGGQFLDPTNRPGFQGTIDKMRGDAQRDIQSMFTGAGRGTPSPGQAGAFGKEFGRQAMPYVSGLYGAERGRQQQAAGMAPGMARAEDEFNFRQLGQVGRRREQQAGMELGDEMARWDFEQNKGARDTQAYLQAIRGGGMPMNSTSTTRGGGGGKGMDLAGLGLQGAGTAGALGWEPFAAAPIAATGGKCWVAREVYGADNPQWLLFRKWMLTMAPKWLRVTYLRYGERLAHWLRDKELLKTVIRKWMDARILGMV